MTKTPMAFIAPSGMSRRIKPLTDEEEAAIQKQIAADPDAPEITDEQASQRMTFKEAMKRSRGRPRLDNPRQQISIRLDPDVVAKFKATGKGWQGRINQALKDAKV